MGGGGGGVLRATLESKRAVQGQGFIQDFELGGGGGRMARLHAENFLRCHAHF